MTEYTFALRSLESLKEDGWTIRGAGDQESTIVTDDARQALDYVASIEHGAIRIQHRDHGSANLSLLFQGGDPEDVIYDFQAATSQALEHIERALNYVHVQGGH